MPGGARFARTASSRKAFEAGLRPSACIPHRRCPARPLSSAISGVDADRVPVDNGHDDGKAGRRRASPDRAPSRAGGSTRRFPLLNAREHPQHVERAQRAGDEDHQQRGRVEFVLD